MADETGIEALAAEVSAWGQEQEQTIAGEASRGAFDAINGLVGVVRDLMKGKQAPMRDEEDEEDEDGDEEDEDGGEDGDDDVDDGDAGFQDMEFSTGASMDEDVFDVTEFVGDLDRKVNALGKMLQAERRENARMRKSVQGLRNVILKLAEADARATTSLAKAVTGLSAGVSALPAPSAFGVAPARRAAPPKANSGDFLGGDERSQMIRLAKGLNRGILDEGQKRRFFVHGQFDEDANENARIRDALAKLD